MQTISRRKFLHRAALFAITAPILGARALLAKDYQPLPPFRNGQTLNAKSLNDMTDRLNELSERP